MEIGKNDILLRLQEYREYTGLSLNAFAGRVGMRQSTLFGQFSGKRELSLDTIINVLSTDRELSAEWVIRGQGDMLNANENSPMQQFQKKIEGLLETIQVMSETIKMKNATIDALQNELSQQKSKEA